MSARPVILAFGLLVLLVGGILLLVSLAGNQWLSVDNSEAHEGLFKGCFKDTCRDLDLDYTFEGDGASQIHATRAMVIIGLVLSGFSSVFGFIFATQMCRNDVPNLRILKWAINCSVAAGIFSFIGVMVYALTYYKETKDSFRQSQLLQNRLVLDHSFRICVAGGCLHIVAAILLNIGGPKRPDTTTARQATIMTTNQHPPTVHVFTSQNTHGMYNQQGFTTAIEQPNNTVLVTPSAPIRGYVITTTNDNWRQPNDYTAPPPTYETVIQQIQSEQKF